MNASAAGLSFSFPQSGKTILSFTPTSRSALAVVPPGFMKLPAWAKVGRAGRPGRGEAASQCLGPLCRMGGAPPVPAVPEGLPGPASGRGREAHSLPRGPCPDLVLHRPGPRAFSSSFPNFLCSLGEDLGLKCERKLAQGLDLTEVGRVALTAACGGPTLSPQPPPGQAS